MVVIWFSLQRQKEQAVLILDAEAVQYYVAKDYPVWYVSFLQCKLEQCFRCIVIQFALGAKMPSSSSGVKLGEVYETILT